MPDFASQLRELRLGRGLRQKDLAAALGLAQTTIANYEQKLRFPDEPTLVKIADYFSVSLDQLMGRGDTAAGGPGSGGANPVDRSHGVAGGPGSDVKAGAGRGDPGSGAPLGGEAREFFRLLREHDPVAARDRLRQALENGTRTADIYAQVITPALHEVGRLWATGEMSVADEHAFSEATLQIMASLLPQPPALSAPVLRCVVLPVSGELHSIGARMAADLLSLSGFDVRFLGVQLSIGHLRETLLASSPDLVALSVTLRESVNAAADTIRAVHEKRALSRTRILVGGEAFLDRPLLWKQLGADAYAVDAEDAVRAARKLFRDKD